MTPLKNQALRALIPCAILLAMSMTVHAEEAGADYIGVGALRTTSTKPDTTVIGLAGIETICRSTTVPVLAIGGVLPADIPTLRAIGVSGVAVSGGILEAHDPESAARAYRDALQAGAR